MTGKIYDSGKFWIMWLSCIDKARSVGEITREWDYADGTKALYQSPKSHPNKSLSKAMMSEGYLDKAGTDSGRGGERILLSSNFDWLENYFKEKYTSSGAFSKIWNEPEEFINLLKADWVRKEVLELNNIKTLFNGKKDFVRKAPNSFFSSLLFVFIEKTNPDLFGFIQFGPLVNMILGNMSGEIELDYNGFKEKVMPIIESHRDDKVLKKFEDDFEKKLGDIQDLMT